MARPLAPTLTLVCGPCVAAIFACSGGTPSPAVQPSAGGAVSVAPVPPAQVSVGSAPADPTSDRGRPCDQCHERWVAPGSGADHDLLAWNPELLPFVPAPGWLPIETVESEFDLWQDRDPGDREDATCARCHGRGVEFGDFAAQIPPGCPSGAGGLAPGAGPLTPEGSGLRLWLRVERQGPWVVADVTVANAGAGHGLPARPWPRRILLEVEAHAAGGAPLSIVMGRRIPQVHRTTGGPATGYAYVRELTDRNGAPTDPGLAPVHAVARDTRLRAGQFDELRWVFAAPGSGEIDLSARLTLHGAGSEPSRLLAAEERRLPGRATGEAGDEWRGE